MAKRTEVLLVQDVLKLGNMGDIVRVPPGYARNYLYPYAMAIPASGAAKRQIEVLREKAAKSEAEREAKANVQKKTVDGMTIQIAARVAHETELFGSIGAKEIVAALAAKGVKLDTKQVHVHDKFRRLGRYAVEVRLHKNVPATINVEVVNSDPNAPSLDETLAQVAKEREAKAAAAKAKSEGKGEAAAEPAEAPAAGEAKKADEAKAEKPGKKDKADKAEKAEKTDKAEKSDKGDKANADKAGKNQKKAKA